MKPAKSILFFCVFSILSFSSCQKCRTCTYRTQRAQQDPSKLLEENHCGTKAALDSWEAQILAEKNEVLEPVGGRVIEFSCSDE